MYLARLLKKNSRVIVSYRNQGLGDNLAAAANAWYFAKQTQRDVVIVWAPCRYLKRKQDNGFPLFFQLPERLEGIRIFTPAQIDPLSRLLIAHSDFFHALFFPDPRLTLLVALYVCAKALGLKNLRITLRAKIEQRCSVRKDKLAQSIYAERDANARVLLVNGCLVPRPELKPFYDALRLAHTQPHVDAFARQHFANKKIIGAHIRYGAPQMGAGSHHKAYWSDPETTLRACQQKINAALTRAGTADAIVFLATDSARVQEFFKKEFTNLVCVEKQFSADETRELHEVLPVETAEATLVEMFLLAQCDLLLRYPPESYFSFYASLYAPEAIT